MIAIYAIVTAFFVAVNLMLLKPSVAGPTFTAPFKANSAP
jgi:hypothetical protein